MATDSLVSKLKPAELKEINDAFKEFDGNNNGSITPQEMKECLRKSKIQYKDSEIAEVIASMDNNHDGSVSYEEYLEFMAHAFHGQIKEFSKKKSTGTKKHTTK